jgi:hypothetical protein
MAHIAQIHYHKAQARLDVVVPKGTLPSATARLNETLTREVIPKLTGHQACLSGLELIIREELADVIQVEIETGKIGPAGIGAGGAGKVGG